jgi:hypothetical protein
MHIHHGVEAEKAKDALSKKILKQMIWWKAVWL